MAIILDDNTDIDTFFGGNSGANSPAAKNREPSEKPREQELPSVDQKAARPPVDSTSSLELPGIQRPQPAKDQPAPVPGMSARDWNDTINTMIAEAGGDGPVGMLAVANVIRNRAERRGKSIGDIVRAPSQFEGYYAPGEKAVQAQQNPQVRAEAEKILRGVLAGELKDPTQGADHFHAGGVNPDWASKMPATTRIGGHVFYNSQPGRNVAQAEQGTYEPGIEPRKYGYANGRGLANLVPEEKEPESGAVGSLSFVHQGQEKINPAFAAILTNVSGDIGRGLVINSGYRSPQHSVEKAKGNGGGEHTHGTAVDISMKGMSKQQRFELVQSLKARGVRRFITYTNSPDMLHVDLKEMPNSKDGFWYMHDKSARNFGKAPDWMQAAARTRIRHERLPAAQPIELDENFQASDPGNFYQGKNPFQAEIDEARASRQEQDAKDEPPAAAPGADIDARLEELNKEAPGRYAAMTEDEYAAWQQDFEANQPGQFMKGFKGALVDQNPTLLGNSLKALGVLFDNETIGGLGDSVREWGKSGSEKRAARVPSFSNIRTDSFSNFVSDATDYAAFSLGNGLGSMAPSVGAGVAGAAVSGGNPIVGFLAGAAGPSYVQNLGDIYGELIENDNIQARVKKGELTDKQLAGWAATGAVPMAALDMVSFGNLFNIATKDAIKQSIGKRIIKGIAEGSLTEGSTEAMQQVVSEGVQEALGADKSRSEQAIAIIDNFIGGALTGGAVGGVGGANPMRSKGSQSDPSAQADAAPASDPQATSEGIPDAAPSPVTGMPEPEVEAPQRKGPLSKAFESGAARTNLEYVVDDRDVDGSGPGPLHGQTVMMAANQDRVPSGMHRVIDGNGVEHMIGDRLLVSLEQAQDSGLRPADVKTASSVTSSKAAPTIGSTVEVNMPGGAKMTAKIDSFSDGEVVVSDDAGEVYQVPLNAIQAPAEPGAEGLPVRDTEAQNDIPAQEPIPTETTVTQDVAPETRQKPIVSADNAPKVGQSVIVDAPGLKRVTGKVERYVFDDGESEAIVREPSGMTIQVPIKHLYVDAMSEKEVQAEEASINPPVARDDIDPSTPRVRKFGEKSVRLPDDVSERIYDLGADRAMAKRLLGASELDKDKAAPPAQRALADELGISFEDAGKLADDYRYRVEKAGRQARSKLPVEMHGVNPVMLERMRKRAEAERAPIADDTATASEPAASEPTATAPIDDAAREAATHPENNLPEPTQAQKEAGNYAKGHVRLGGMDLSIENPAGSQRKGVDANGKAWSTTMQSHYGYIKGTVGRDKDHIDVFVKPGTADLADDAKVFVVDQKSPATGRFDEHKVMIGFETQQEAEAAYLANYTPGWKGMGDVTESTLADFKRWTKDGDTSKAFAPKWFGNRTRAEGYISKHGLGDTHSVVENGKRFEIRPVDRSAPEVDIKVNNPEQVEQMAEAARTASQRNERGKQTAIIDALADLFQGFSKEQTRAIIQEEVTNFGFDKLLFQVRRAKNGGGYETMWFDTAGKVISRKQNGQPEMVRDGTYRDALSSFVDVPQSFDPAKFINKAITDAEGTRARPAEETTSRSLLGGKVEIVHVTQAKKTKPAKPELRGDPLPERGVAPANIGSDGNTYVGKPGSVHFEIERPDGVEWTDVGFVNPSGRFLDRKEAFDWVEQNEKRVRPSDNMDGGLDALDYREQVPERDRKSGKKSAEKLDELIDSGDVATAADAEANQWGANNKLVSRDRADEIRKKLRDKLRSQIGSGIDPEILALGTELAAFHIEAGARRFADFARAVAADMDTSIEKLRPFLRAWYNGARDMMEDSGLDISGTDDANAVKSELATLKDAPDGSLSELETPSGTALETVPAETVRGTEKGGSARNSTDRSRGTDGTGNEPANRERVPTGRSVPDGQGTVSVPARGKQRDVSARNGPDLFDASNDRRREKRQQDNGSVSEKSLPDNVDPAKRVAPADSAATPAHNRADNFAITEDDAIGEGGAKTKFRNNVAAIRLLRQLEQGGRQASHAEQKLLAKWVGWGGLQQAFVRPDGSLAKGWEAEAKELKDLLSPEEYRAAESSTRNAHYTSPEIVKAIWSVAQRLGFRGGRVLEPSVGSGNFLGLAPGALKGRAQFTGAELDPITGGIAKQLYPAANIKAPLGFQDLQIPDNYFELAVGNPPFGSERLYDPKRKEAARFSIHNYFFAKSVETLKPGGVLAMVITNSFMDAANTAARAYIADRARLVGAIRLPNNAFLANAGTEVTTDIVILQKYADGTPAAEKDRSWVNIGSIRDKEGRETPLNEYFVQHPEMMLGDFGRYGTMYGPEQPALVSRPGEDLQALLKKSIDALPADILPSRVTEEVADNAVQRELDPVAVPVGSLMIGPDGNIEMRVPDFLNETRTRVRDDITGKDKDRITGMVKLRDTFTKLRRAQIDEHASDSDIESLRGDLNREYDAFVKDFGPLNADTNRRAFQDDPTWPQVSALETDFDKGLSKTMAAKTGEKARPATAKKAPIFARRTQEPYRRPDSAATAKDALAIVLGDVGYVDMPRIAALYGKPEPEIVKELGDRIYLTPDGSYETADLYLSGNVKQKLARAEEAANENPAFSRNVQALRDVIPADIEPVDIDVKAGAPWVPAKHVADFVNDMLEISDARATYAPSTARWEITARRASDVAGVKWGTPDVSAKQVMEAALNARTITVSHKTRDGQTIIDEGATEAANQKVEALKNEWKRWIWDNDARREELARLYNDIYNTHVDTVYDGSHLTLPGKVSDDIIELRPHQKSFVWRVLQSPTTLADHTVGAGKTFAAIAAVMELRRTGQAKKPMLVVPNHLVQQWAADFIKLYPGANILAATKKDFESTNRKRFFARVAAGDYDAVIVAHSSFGLIGVDPVYEAEFIRMQVDDLEASIRTLEESDGKSSRSVKQMAKQRDALEERMQKLLDVGGKDAGMTFEEMGVDGLIVDEAHEFKNLGFATSLTRVAGLGNKTGSKKAADLFMKIQSVLKRTGGRNVAFLTGTPISNTMAELYTMQRYLAYDALKAQGVQHFDAWARVFGEIVTEYELSAAGKYKLTTRFSRFTNMPELVTQYRAFADTITNDDIKRQLAEQGKTLPLPRVKGGKPTNNIVQPSEYQLDYIGQPTIDENGNESYPEGSIVWRSENMPKKAEKGADNMLKITSDARKAALDMRLVDPNIPDVPGTKVNLAADKIKGIYRKWDQQKGTQLVFIDLSTPKKAVAKARAELVELQTKADAGDEAAQAKLDNISLDEIAALESAFSVYDDLKAKLIRNGIPEREIAFIHDANTDLQKQELFGKVRSGQIRVLIGSTPKMGAGTNVQNRLVALHHLDAPWRPSDLEQREGRIIRQGNELYAADPDGFEVEIHRYGTERTLDAKQWQTIEQKARFIGQFRAGNIKDRVVEDIGGEAANAAEMKAAASGNPMVLEEMELRRRIKRLENDKREHDRSQHSTRRQIASMERQKEEIEGQADVVKADADAATKFMGGDFSATINGKAMEKLGDVGTEILAVARDMVKTGAKSRVLGAMGPFKLSLEHSHGLTFDVLVSAARDYDVSLPDVGDLTPVGTAMRVMNLIRNLPDRPALEAERLSNIDKTLPRLREQLSKWDKSAELDEARQQHANVMSILRPVKKPAPTVNVEKGSEPVKASIAEQKPVARLTGEEVLKNFKGGEDMPALRRQAQAWYDQNLVEPKTTVTMKDGTVVGFNGRGKRETTYGRKGDILLRSVPAIPAIIENGEIVHREAGDERHSHVLERVVIAAPIELAGKIHNLAVAVNRTRDGDWHYDLNTDNRFVGKDSYAGRPSYQDLGERGAEPLLSALEGTSRSINIFEWASDGNAPAESGSIRDALARGPLGETVGRLIDSGALQLQKTGENAVQGWTTPDGTIVLNTDGVSPDNANAVLLHEAFHSGARKLIGTASWNKLLEKLGQIHRQYERSTGKARSYFDKARARVENAERATGDMPGALRAEEFGAYAIEEYETAPRSLRMWADDFLGHVKAWALKRFGKQLGRVTPAQLRALAVAALRDISKPDGNPPRPELSKRFSIADDSFSTVNRANVREAADAVRGRLTDWTPKALALVPLNYFTELAQKGQEAIGTYLTVKRQLDAYRGNRHAEADQTVQQWRKYNRLGKDKAAALADVMHQSTIAQYDPSIDNAPGDRAKNAALQKAYDALPDAGKRLYQSVRDSYAAQTKELDGIILDNLKKVFQIAQTKAERKYRKELERISRQQMDPAARKQAQQDAAEVYEATATKAKWSMKARLTKMRQALETSRMEGPYFPLARFGDYFVTVKDITGEVLHFSMHERSAERDKVAADMRKQFPNGEVIVGIKSNSNELQRAMDPRVIADIQAIIGKSNIDSDIGAQILDQIWQRYLQTMPDMSVRKRQIHRKNVAGFHGDALRAYASHMFHSAHQMGRLKYGVELNELVERASEEASEAANPTKAGMLANELRKRHQWVMNPTGSQFAQNITSAAFVWFLAGSPAAAAVNLAQTPMMGIPILGAKFGTAKTTSALLRASADLFRGKGSVNHALLTADEKAALEHFYETGLIDRTQSHDLAGVGETGVDYSPWRAAVMAKLSYFFHKSEVINREVTALAAYRLARNSGMRSERAIEAAHDLTWKVHFDYSNSSRARVLQSDFAKVALVFRSYQMNMIYRIVRDAQQAFKGESKEVRREALYQLTGALGMMALTSGVTGIFGFNAAMIALGMLFGDDDDPFEFETKVKKTIVDVFGKELGGMILNGPVGYLTGVDLTNRIGMADIWFRSPNRDLDGQQEYQYWIMSQLGAGVSMGSQFWQGGQQLAKGEYWRATETVLPKFLRDPMKAFRYYNEGVRNARGDDIVPEDQINAFDAARQGIGFTPAKVTEAWERNSTLKNAEKRLNDRRRQLMNEFAIAVEQRDPDARRAVLKRIQDFNASPYNRAIQITGETLQRSLRTRRRNAQLREDGALITNREMGAQLRRGLPERIN
ncbi:PLxRFG domain-containing protein (plasmid) [Brucella pseudintermedia]|uniref:PLxRFG domain-containing protein n=1 Tax=Brucella pseudintermedia TaxID=370111 RepID=UPI002AC8D475|nr:PLxRFG domain-containing protein [Brucella pseudintermedia]WPM83133.1 PLxRFG domain-containing protein [Brucella pseudintermedia]